MTDRSKLPELPDAMAERAKWSREEAVRYPSKVEVDHELLPWVYCEEDELWYSFDGNYSGISPAEKKKQHDEYLAKQDAYRKKHEEETYKRYLEITYWSKIREGILKRDNNQCQLCGKKGPDKLHIHHIMKRNENGTDHFDNLLTVCPSCHKKADGSFYNPDWIS